MGAPSSFDSFFILTKQNIAERDAVQPRRWGMVVTVTNDADANNNKDWYLQRGESSVNLDDNDNWIVASQPPTVFDGEGVAFTAKVFVLPGQDNIPVSSSIKVRCEIVARRDGVNESYAKEMIGLFNKASDGTFTLVGAVTDVFEVDGFSGTTPTAVLNVTGNSIIVTYNSNIGGANAFLAGKWEIVSVTDVT